MRSPVKLSESKKRLFLEPEVVTYLKNVEKLKKNFTKDEERELIIRAQKGDIEARNTLVEDNLKFVVACAKEFHNHKTNIRDLISSGNLGLINAINKYDLTKDSKLISCAVWWIKAELQNYIYDNTLVHIPLNKIKEVEKVNARIKSTEEKGDFLNAEDTFSSSKVSYSQASSGMENLVSLDISNSLENEDAYEIPSNNTIDSYSIFKSKDNLYNVNKVLKVLTPLEKELFVEKYGIYGEEARTDEVLCTKFGISSFVVKKTIKSSIEKINKVIKIEELV